MSTKHTTETFIQRSKEIHGEDTYTYDKAVYTGLRDKITLGCPIHGYFEITVIDHIGSLQRGCRKCSHERYLEKDSAAKTLKFINNSKREHGEDTYNYDKTKFIKSSEKLIITCPIHGDFEITPINHLYGEHKSGCPICGRKKAADVNRLSTEEFIQKLKDRMSPEEFSNYDFSKTDYVDGHKPIIITCKIHGDWKTYPSHFTYKGSCPKCAAIEMGMNKRGNNETFLRRYAINRPDDEPGHYSFEKLNYVDKKTPVIITCNMYDHGDFEMRPSHFLHMKQDCPKCSPRAVSKGEFLERAKEAHGDKYNYDEIDYSTGKVKVKIWCNTCKEFFWQMPTSHIKSYTNDNGVTTLGTGCEKCAHREVADLRRLTNEKFLEQAALMKKEGSYDYSKIDCHAMKEKITIICNTCGLTFQQTPDSHLRGAGCPACASSKGEKLIADILATGIYGTDWEREKGFWDLRSEIDGVLKYDFYIPKYNLLIEFHGKQHYEHIEFFHKTAFIHKLAQDRDSFKARYAHSENFNFLVIPYSLYVEKDTYETNKHRIEKFINKKIASIPTENNPFTIRSYSQNKFAIPEMDKAFKLLSMISIHDDNNIIESSGSRYVVSNDYSVPKAYR